MSQRFISVLLKANAPQQESFYALQVPRIVFTDNKSEIRWIYEYRDKYRHYPSRGTFRQRFPDFKFLKVDETVEEAFQEVLDQHLFNEVAGMVDKAKEMRSGGRGMHEVVGFIRKASQEISTYDTGYIDLSVSKSKMALDRYRQRVISRIRGHTSHQPSPWPTYNELVGFCEYGEHNVITSRTSIGKTWQMLYWADHFRKMGETVLIVSKEMPTPQIGDRHEALVFGLPYTAFRKGELPPKLLRKWKEERKTCNLGNMIITGQETITGVGFSHIISKIQQYRPTVMFVDGAYLIMPEGLSRGASPVERYTMVSNTMKRLCMAYKIIGFSVIQINRSGENKGGDTTPSLKDIYGADAWAQDADNVFIIGGKRGANSRVNSLAKGRESNVGEFLTRYELNPKPDFSEMKSLKSLSSGAVEFQAV